jgi:hypothetical protein
MPDNDNLGISCGTLHLNNVLINYISMYGVFVKVNIGDTLDVIHKTQRIVCMLYLPLPVLNKQHVSSVSNTCCIQ